MMNRQPLLAILSKVFLSILISFFINKAALAKEAATQNNFIIAKVNNQIITNIDVINAYNFFISSLKVYPNSDQEKVHLIKQVVNKMIDEELIRQEAIRLNINVSNHEIDEALRKMNKSQSLQTYREQAAVNLAWNKIVDREIRPNIRIYDSEIGEFFEEKKINRNVDQFLIAQIVINNTDSFKLIKEIHNQLKAGANFDAMVAKYSDLSTKENNGLVGLVGKGDVDDRIYLAISKLQKNQYSEPVVLEDGYHVFKVLDKKLSSKLNPDDVTLANNAIFNQKLQILAKGYLTNLRKKSFIQINPIPAGFLSQEDEYFID